jgi:hypothetical protein
MHIRVREILTAEDAAFEAAYSLYEESFPIEERESREHILGWLQPTQISRTGQERVKRFFVLEREGVVIGMTVHEYHPSAELGWLIYIVVRLGERGGGLGNRLLQAVSSSCRLDAEFFGAGYRGLILEVERIEDAQTDADREFREARLAYFSRRGAQKLTSRYVQPALGDDLEPVPLNLLIIDGASELDSATKRKILRDYLVLMWHMEEGSEAVRYVLSEFD